MHRTPDPTTERLERLLNGRLTVTLMVLELDLAAWRPQPLGHLDETLPFMPYRAAAAVEPGGDIGLGAPVCHAVVTEFDRASVVRFGRSVGTALEAFYGSRADVAGLADDVLVKRIDEDGSNLYVGPPGYCLSLWSTRTPGLAVLAIEQLSETDRSVPTTVDHRPEELADLVARLLKQYGEPITFQQLGFDMPKKHALRRRDRRKRLVDLIVPSSETTRGTRLARALTVVSEAGMQTVVDDFVAHLEGDFDTTDEQQETGYVPTPRHVELVTEPAVRSSSSGASTDGRLVLLNIDAMSVRHDLFGSPSEHFISATIPVLADLAAVEKTFEDLRRAVSADAGQWRRQVKLLHKIRRAEALRKLVRVTTGPEQAVAWSNSQQLASHLHETYDPQRERISAVTSSSADLVGSVRDAVRQEKEFQRAGALAAITVVGAVLGGFGVLGALVEVSNGPWDWLADYAGWIVFPPVIGLVVTAVVGAFRHRFRS